MNYCCPICYEKDAAVIGDKTGFEVLKCQKCGSLFTQNKIADNEKFDYSHYYEDSNLSVPEFIYGVLDKTIAGFAKFRLNNRLLDVGCGAGILLERARAGGWEAEGIEVSAPAVEHLTKKGFKVFHGTLEEAGFPDNYFDVITATEILEHIDKPGQVLREIHRILRPKGLLWITTPHGEGISAKILGAQWSIVSPPEHLHLFSRKGMRLMLAENGFTELKSVTNGVNPFELYQFISGRSKVLPNNEGNSNGVEASAAAPQFDRVKTGYKLNQWLSTGFLTKKAKDLINFALSTTNLGDTLKIWAVKK